MLLVEQAALHAPQLFASTSTAVQDTPLTDVWYFAAARATGSPTSQAWKESIQNQIAEQAQAAPVGALELELSFRVGLTRNWVGLWKQSIDALGPILGLENPARRFHPADGRIVHLGLHRTLAPELGGDVELGVWWRPSIPVNNG